MSTFPSIMTARQLIEREIIPCSEDMLKAIAKTHHIGRMLGRTIIFQPSDIEQLIEALPCPSNSSEDTAAKSGTYAGLSEESASMKALALAMQKPLRKSASNGKRNSSKGQSTVIPLHGRSTKRP